MKDKLSALIDGDLEDHAVHPLLDRLKQDASLRMDWDAYCFIGDAIRGEHHGTVDFVTRVMAGLDAEPTVLAPASAQDLRVRRRGWRELMPLAASVMGVAAVGFIAATLYSQDAPAPALAAHAPQAAPAVASAVPPPPVRSGADDEPWREYLVAHQGASGGPMPAAVQYIRTVSVSSGGGQ